MPCEVLSLTGRAASSGVSPSPSIRFSSASDLGSPRWAVLISAPHKARLIAPLGLHVIVLPRRHHETPRDSLIIAMLVPVGARERAHRVQSRSEEHTSELQSHLNLVCR